ncbi:MAG: MerR family transcriptional regulator [Defluviitaleaceae bacterium]|nr:MerR family transcriptional regulator [Defluviitaleaceae bacterium]
MSKYTTGELAKLCNVSVRTVQFYDTKGLLPPSELSEGGRRLYSDEDLRKFQFIFTLKAIGLSLNSIKNVLESELSGEILTIFLDEQAKSLASEIDERQNQLEMVQTLKECIYDKAIVPVNTIIDIEGIMEKKNKFRNKKKLTTIYVGVGIVATLGFLFMVWLAVARIWWGLGVYIAVAIISLLISAIPLKDKSLICPKCNSVFKPSLWRTFFSVGDNKVRFMTCPECGHKDWCVLRKQTQIWGAENND